MLLFWAQKAKTSTIYKSVILKFDKYVLVTFTTVLQEQQYGKLLIHNIFDYNNNNYSSIITFRESFISQNITSSIFRSVRFSSVCLMFHEIQIHEKPRFIQIYIVHKFKDTTYLARQVKVADSSRVHERSVTMCCRGTRKPRPTTSGTWCCLPLVSSLTMTWPSLL